MSGNPHFTGVVAEVHGYQTQEIPASLKSNNSAQAIRANNRHFQLSTSSSSSQGSGGVLLWQIPPTNGAISRETMFLRCRITATCGTAPTYADAANALTFKGPGALVAGVKSDGTATAGSVIPALSNGYSWIQRLTLYGTGSSVVDQCNYVNSTMDMLLAHNSNPSFLAYEGQASMGVARPWDATPAGTNAYIDLCLPVPLSCFNNSPTIAMRPKRIAANSAVQPELSVAFTSTSSRFNNGRTIWRYPSRLARIRAVKPCSFSLTFTSI